MDDYNTYRIATCVQCGRSFKDDCGWDFCSGSCENQFEHEQKECAICGYKQEHRDFPDGEHCEDCLDEILEDEH